jgi:hypothetical protein
LLNLGRENLVLVVGHGEPKLFRARLDCVPALRELVL